MDGIIIIAILSAVAIAAIAGNSRPQGLEGIEDELVRAEDIRKGVARGWYDAVLIRVDGQPCVRVSGKATNGSNVTDIFRLSQEDFDALQADGFLIVGS